MLHIHTNYSSEIVWTVGQEFPKLESPPNMTSRFPYPTEIQAYGKELKEILKLMPALGEPPFSPGGTPEMRTWKDKEAVLLYTVLRYAFGWKP